MKEIKIVSTFILLIYRLAIYAQTGVIDSNNFLDGSLVPVNIDELIKTKKKGKEKEQYISLQEFNEKYGEEADIEVLEFDYYFELTVKHPNKDGYIGGAECYKLNKKTKQESLLWHEHPMEYETIEEDTLLSESYKSVFEHEITLKKCNEGGLYGVEITLNNGTKRNYVVAESKYIAMHTYILWENKDFIFVRYSCGTECWGGQLLPIDGSESLRIYSEYVLSDGKNNIIAFPDENDFATINIENLITRETISRKLNLCVENNSIANTIKEVYILENQLYIICKDVDCTALSTEIIQLDF